VRQLEVQVLYPTVVRSAFVGGKGGADTSLFPHRTAASMRSRDDPNKLERPRRSVKEEFLQRVSNHSTGFLNPPTTRRQRPRSFSEVMCFVRCSYCFTRRSNNSHVAAVLGSPFITGLQSDIQINVEYVHSDVK